MTSARVSGSALLSCCSVVFHRCSAIKFHENPQSDDVLTFITHNPTAGVSRDFFPVSLLCCCFLVFISTCLSLTLYFCIISPHLHLFMYFIYAHIYISTPISIYTPLPPLPLLSPCTALSLHIHIHISLSIFISLWRDLRTAGENARPWIRRAWLAALPGRGGGGRGGGGGAAMRAPGPCAECGAGAAARYRCPRCGSA